MKNPVRKLLNHPRVADNLQMIIVVAVVVFLGLAALIFVRADTPLYQSDEAESGSIGGCATVITDSTASNGSAVTFGSCSGN